MGVLACQEFFMTWPFPPFPNPKNKDQRQPKFDPENEDDAPL